MFEFNENRVDIPLRDPTKAAAGSKPNIVIIVADDLGYGDTSLYGHSIVTPNIQIISTGRADNELIELVFISSLSMLIYNINIF